MDDARDEGGISSQANTFSSSGPLKPHLRQSVLYTLLAESSPAKSDGRPLLPLRKQSKLDTLNIKNADKQLMY
jgi:hypothetical protein